MKKYAPFLLVLVLLAVGFAFNTYVNRPSGGHSGHDHGAGEACTVEEESAADTADTGDTATSDAALIAAENEKDFKSDKVVTTKSGLKYLDVKVGTGASPKKGQTVVVHYTGWFTDGREFDSSLNRNEPLDFVLQATPPNVIAGWDEGVATMKIGGKRKLMIPPALGYGETGYGDIPGNSTLLFEVELLEVK